MYYTPLDVAWTAAPRPAKPENATVLSPSEKPDLLVSDNPILHDAGGGVNPQL